MAQIEVWLKNFEKYWKSKNVEKVLNLFTEDVNYYETPFQKLSLNQLKEEWQTIKQQKDIKLDFEVFSSKSQKHTVKWELSYTQNGDEEHLKGVYLIELDSKGKCVEFWQYCQS